MANAAVDVYDELIDLFGEPQIKAFIATLGRPEIASRLDHQRCAERFQGIAQRLGAKVVSQPMKRVFNAIIAATPALLPSLWNDTQFRRLVAQT